MGEQRIYLSPLFQHSTPKSEYVFTNVVDDQLTRCTKSLRVRLLSFYSPINLPPSYIYIEGMKRRSFGGLENEDFFPLPRSIGGKRHEDCHLYTGHFFYNLSLTLSTFGNLFFILQLLHPPIKTCSFFTTHISSRKNLTNLLPWKQANILLLLHSKLRYRYI